MTAAPTGQPQRDVVLVGVVGGQRATACTQSLRAAGHRVSLLDFEALLEESATSDAVAGALASTSGAAAPLVRLESPSDDPRLDERLVLLGGGGSSRVADATLLDTRSWTQGLGRALARLDEHLAAASVHRLYDTRTVLTMFDKARTHAVLHAASVPVAPALPAARTWPALREAAAAVGWRGLFVKSRFGSSGAGICAVRWQGQEVAAYTTVGFRSDGDGLPDRPVNQRVRRVTAPDELARVVEAIAAAGGVHAERWIPKFGFGRGVVDLRVVVIAGRARQVLARTGPGPLTNLHLGADRADVSALAAGLGPRRWTALLHAAEQAAHCFRRAHHCGVDVGIDSLGRPFVLELNAFGDFHEGVCDADGLDTYTAEVQLAGAER